VVAWLVVLLYITGMSATVWLERRLGVRDENPLENVVILVGFGMFAVVGALLVARRPANAVGWILIAVGIMVGIFPAGETYAAYVMTTRGQPDALAVAGAWTNAWYWYLLLALAFIYLPLYFPDGRLPSRRWLPVAVVAGIALASAVVLGALTDTLRGQDVGYRIDNPIGIEGLAPVEELPVFGVLLFGIFALGTIGAAASVVVRFRRSRGIERQQLKWFLYAAALIPASFALDYVPGFTGDLVFGLVIFGLPTAIGIAVLRYRLYDIDVIINRTLVYGLLTVFLALVYFGSVIALQYVLRTLTGQAGTLAIVASTLTIAALFNPLRRRIQELIDRRFYRRKYDSAKTLESFSARLRDETDLNALSEDLVGVVRGTMQPEHVSLWLRPAHIAGSPDRAGEVRG
jgi:pimeloyl-ACP methyl ester carboxylesterase